jgi:tryptophan halogenase
MGQGIQPGAPHPLARAIGDADLRTLLHRIRQPVQETVAKMPTQAEFIERYCKAAPDAWQRGRAVA